MSIKLRVRTPDESRAYLQGHKAGFAAGMQVLAEPQVPIAWACERHKEWRHTNDMREVARLATSGWIIYSMYVDDRDWMAEWSKQERSSP